jgi:undecaprenyl diphosphate synthase
VTAPHAPQTPLLEVRGLPMHVGIIMDGNGRWAQQRDLDRSEGHKEGSKAVRRIVRAARRLGLKALTVYAFSEQNWARPELEVGALMDLLKDFLITEREEILGNGIRLQAVGNLGRLPAFVRAVLDPLRNESSRNDEMTLNLALSYGGREEIAHAARELAEEVKAGRMRAEDITPDALRSRMPSLQCGDPDLIIRTGGEQRISNFLLFGSAYAELVFSDKLWPDFGVDDLYAAIVSYQQRERRFGKTGAQTRAETQGTTACPT